jgi:hypothetical protein
LPDFICIADRDIYVCRKFVHIGPHCSTDSRDSFAGLDKAGGIVTNYIRHAEDSGYSYEGEVLGTLISYLTERMAFEDPSLRQFAHYIYLVSQSGGWGWDVLWKKSNLSMEVIRRLIREGYQEETWSRWQEVF